MRISFLQALFFGQKTLLLILFIFSYAHISFGQNQKFAQLHTFYDQRHAYLFSENDFYIVRDSAIDESQIVFRKKLIPGYLIIKVHSGQAFRFIAKANTNWKLAPPLLKLRIDKQPYFSGQLNYIVMTYDALALEKELHLSGVPIIEQRFHGNAFIVRFNNQESFERILASPYVTFLDQQRPNAIEETLSSSQDLSINTINHVHAHNPHLTGEDMNVSIRERSIEKSDIDLRGRIIDSPLEDALISFHANQMATIIAGGGNSSEDSKGIAWKSEIVSASFGSAFPDPPEFFSDFGISVQNHSYGFDIENYYGAEAHAFDLLSNQRENLLHVFSSGNRGEETSFVGPYAGVSGFANLTGNLKMSKNSICASGHYQDFLIDSRNSRGPAFDGRIKPEVTAFGPEGTSDAAAYVSGIALLLQDAYRSVHGTFPSSSLVKAVLAASADDILRPGPDYESGFGSVNATRAVTWMKSNFYYEDEINPEETKVYDIDVPPQISKLRVGITWNDPAASAGSAQSLVNDLDLQVEREGSGEVVLPWTLNSYPHVDSLSKPAARGDDHLNNIEMITIDDPPSGKYFMKIKGYDIIGSQKYSLVFWLDTASTFKWTFPSRADKKESDTEIYLRWNTTYTGSGQLSVSNDGMDYEPVGEIQLQNRFFSWRTPAGVNSLNFKMSIAGNDFVSDTLLVAPPSDFEVGYNCPGKGMLNWATSPEADSYVLYNLKEKYLEPVILTPDTVFLFNTADLSPYFAVAPVFNGMTAKRSLTYDYTNRGVSCYYKFFDVQVNEQGRAELSVYLSTLYNVDNIIFQKKLGNEFITIGQTAPTGLLEHEFVDETVEGGVTIYRAIISLVDGGAVITNEAPLIFADEHTYAVFPNPWTRSGSPLNIITDAENISIEFVNASGQLLKSAVLSNTFFQMDISALPPGLYLYRFLRGSSIVKGGRLLVR
jgi:hypothetical protein